VAKRGSQEITVDHNYEYGHIRTSNMNLWMDIYKNFKHEPHILAQVRKRFDTN
jgi:hypothetical protein